MTDIRDPNNKNPEITPLSEHDVPIPGASKAQKPLTDEEIHIKEMEDSFHSEYDNEEIDEEIEIDW